MAQMQDAVNYHMLAIKFGICDRNPEVSADGRVRVESGGLERLQNRTLPLFPLLELFVAIFKAVYRQMMDTALYPALGLDALIPTFFWTRPSLSIYLE